MVLSGETNPTFGIASGYVEEISTDSIKLRLNRNIDTFSQTLSLLSSIGDAENSKNINFSQELRYRIDKDEFTNGIRRARLNIFDFCKDSKSRRKRKLIIDLNEPLYEEEEMVLHNPSALNADQRKAVLQVKAGSATFN